MTKGGTSRSTIAPAAKNARSPTRTNGAMAARAAGDDVIAELHVAAEERAVGERHAVAERRVVRDVGAHHEEAPGPDRA